MENRLSLTLRSTVTELERLSREFGQFADRHGLAPEVRFYVNLALEEIVTNVICHGYKDRDGQSITVEVAVAPGELTAWVEDAAPAFNPLQLSPPDVTAPLEQRRPGGLGIYLAKKLLDGLQYSRIDGKNRLELRKRL
ncbi:MAG TPA: ATP-binding protein [Gemmataceae bacterium]|nr:ATP-binding protein [Gemmataceae bacterium]